MKQGRIHFITAMTMALLWLLPAPTALAEGTDGGKTGTTITLDGNSCHIFKSSGAKGNGGYALLRHDQARVVVLTSHLPGLSTTLPRVFGKIDNNLKLNDAQQLQISSYSDDNGPARKLYVAIIAPLGYSIQRYQMAVDNSASTTGVAITRYAYGNGGEVVPTSESVTTASGDGTLKATLQEKDNALYFMLEMPTESDCVVTLKKLKINYAIDCPFTAQLPAPNGAFSVHTDVFDLGIITRASDKSLSFNAANLKDTQAASVKNASGNNLSRTAKAAETQCFAAIENTDYYIEAPAKYRIVGATVNLKRSGITYNVTEYQSVTTPVDGGQYILTNGNGNYLKFDGETPENTTNRSQATLWTFKKSSIDGYWYIKKGDNYLYDHTKNIVDGNVTSTGWYLRLTTTLIDDCLWGHDKYGWFNYNHNSNPYRYIGYDIQNYTKERWTMCASSMESWYQSNAKLLLPVEKTITKLPGDYTASIYSRDNCTVKETASVMSGNSNPTLTVSDFNNDAIHIKISNLADGTSALFNVTLRLLPLNPEIQALDVARLKYDGSLEGNRTVVATNFNFANGEMLDIPVVEDEAYRFQIVVRNAKNEEHTAWYGDGTKNNTPTGGYSNYFLKGSKADSGGNLFTTNYPNNRTNANEFYYNVMEPDNVKRVASGYDKVIKDNDWKTSASSDTYDCYNRQDRTIQVYSADKPTWNIMPSGTGTTHIDYRRYTMNVRPVADTYVADVTLTTIYDKTLKGESAKSPAAYPADSKLDDAHTFIGVKVNSHLSSKSSTKNGVLKGTAVAEAIKTAIGKKSSTNYGFGDDALRGILYVDMSELAGVSNEGLDDLDKATADNCLYFLPAGDNRQAANTMHKTGDGFEANADVTVVDQQPFFTPYAFTTLQRHARYTRLKTHGKPLDKVMTAVLPFAIRLDGGGHPMLANGSYDGSVTFNNLNESAISLVGRIEGQGYSYSVKATPATGGTTEANKPYYVTSTADTGGFVFSVSEADFAATPKADAQSSSLKNDDVWQAFGSYCGYVGTKADDRWIFAGKTLRNTSVQKSANFYILPFRAYVVPQDPNSAKASVFNIVTDGDETTTGISEATVAGGKPIAINTGHGRIAITAGRPATVSIHSVGGQLVAKVRLAAGETASYGVAQGVYVVNGTKVVVR